MLKLFLNHNFEKLLFIFELIKNTLKLVYLIAV